MTIIQKSQKVPYTCEQMFQLVDDIEKYPEFLPYCSASTVHFRTEDEVQATLVIAAAGMNKSFTTKNLLQHNKMIELRLIDGPFNHLEGFWRFDSLEDGCHLTFDLEFEFNSRMMSMLLGPIFEQVTNKMVEAFCERANQMYDLR